MSDIESSSTAISTIHTPQLKPSNLADLSKKTSETLKKLSKSKKSSKNISSNITTPNDILEENTIGFFDNFNRIFNNKYFWIIVFLLLCLLIAIYYYNTYMIPIKDDTDKLDDVKQPNNDEEKHTPNKPKDTKNNDVSDDELNNITKKDLLETIMQLQVYQNDLQQQFNKLKKEHKKQYKHEKLQQIPEQHEQNNTMNDMNDMNDINDIVNEDELNYEEFGETEILDSEKDVHNKNDLSREELNMIKQQLH